MELDSIVSGRKERRLPIVLVVNLVPLHIASGERAQRTYTDNISPHGVRLNSAFAWHPGEQVEITPVKGGAPMRGDVVYSQKLEDGRFFIGVKFSQAAIPWPILGRFDGLTLNHNGDWNFGGPRLNLLPIL